MLKVGKELSSIEKYVHKNSNLIRKYNLILFFLPSEHSIVYAEVNQKIKVEKATLYQVQSHLLSFVWSIT